MAKKLLKFLVVSNAPPEVMDRMVREVRAGLAAAGGIDVSDERNLDRFLTAGEASPHDCGSGGHGAMPPGVPAAMCATSPPPGDEIAVQQRVISDLSLRLQVAQMETEALHLRKALDDTRRALEGREAECCQLRAQLHGPAKLPPAKKKK